ncbi:hypothetical protein F4780DRAFT_782191 [Xylariomycetidae sp. FL0641]|nr:hypothetical protein F4780DRAFT_782191 [Xylariomycetidae sp. FL0641]
MVQTRRERKAAAGVKLTQPDRSGPTEPTLLQLAQERNLFDQADQQKDRLARERQDGDHVGQDDADVALPPAVDRFMEALLWAISLSMLHFTLDVLVQHQYAVDLVWPPVISRFLQALVVFLLLIYVLHPHSSSPVLLPGLPTKFQEPLRQFIFLATSTVAGCYLVYISNTYSYLAVMKRSPPLGCLWVWSVIELNLTPAIASLAITLAFFFQGGYSISTAPA